MCAQWQDGATGDTRYFSDDPARSYDYRVTFHGVKEFMKASFAVGYATNITGLNIVFKHYEIKEGGRASVMSLPVGIEPITVTFEGLLIHGNDQYDYLRNVMFPHLTQFGLAGIFGISASRSPFGGLATLTGSGVEISCTVERLEKSNTTVDSAAESVVTQSFMLGKGAVKEAMLADNISTEEKIAMEKMVVVFNDAEFL